VVGNDGVGYIGVGYIGDRVSVVRIREGGR
jgi:hypothetical protein